jgi:ketopantoate reductase
MNILIYGAGVLGSRYAVALNQAWIPIQPSILCW